MRVKQNGGERRGIDAELLLLGNLCRQLRIQCVDAFHDENVARAQAQLLSTLLAPARLEVIARQFHLITAEECVELLIDEFHIEGVQAFVVELTFLVAWCPLAVHEVVVERDLDRPQAVGHQLYRQPFARGGLTTRRRTSDENHAYARPLGNHIGDATDLLLLQSLRHMHDVACHTLLHSAIECAHRANAKDVLPAVVLLEDLEHLVLARQFAKHSRIRGRRNAQQQTIVVRHEVEQRHQSRVWQQCTIEIVHVAIQVVIRRIELSERLQQLYF